MAISFLRIISGRTAEEAYAYGVESDRLKAEAGELITAPMIHLEGYTQRTAPEGVVVKEWVGELLRSNSPLVPDPRTRKCIAVQIGNQPGWIFAGWIPWIGNPNPQPVMTEKEFWQWPMSGR